MILRRVIEHVRAQDWFAVALDFLIVVVGVFMGLQVQEWNTERKEAIQERKYLERLHGEVKTAVDEMRNLNALYNYTQSQLQIALDVINDSASVEKLTGSQCASIFFSHVYEQDYQGLPTVEELLTSGRLSTLRHDELRSLLAKHQQHLTGWQRVLMGMLGDRLVISRVHPNLFQIKPGIRNFDLNPTEFIEQEMENSATCDLAGMRQSAAFKNDLVDNVTRQGIAARQLSRQRQILIETHDVLDTILSIEHTTGAQ